MGRRVPRPGSPVRGCPGSGECRLWLFFRSRALTWPVFLPKSGLAAAAPSRAWIGDWPLRPRWEKGPSLVLGAIKVQKCDPHRRRSEGQQRDQHANKWTASQETRLFLRVSGFGIQLDVCGGTQARGHLPSLGAKVTGNNISEKSLASDVNYN